jgi:glycosyltransferase involved in cell wall biosynthesis
MNAGASRVLHVIKGLGPGGAEHLLVAGAPYRSERYSQVEVAYLLPWKDHLVSSLNDRGVGTHCLGGGQPIDPRWVSRLVRLVHQHDVGLIHLHSPVAAAMARPALRALARRVAVVSTEHNSWASHSAATRQANRATYRLGDAWIAVSDEVRSSLPKGLRDRTEVIIHGIDTTRVAEARRQREAVRAALGLADHDIGVITVANLRAQKAYPTLLRAARLVVDRDSAIRFFAVGQGPLEAELVAERDQLGLRDHFSFLGHRTDVAALLGAMDVFTLASDHEGLPLALMEAMAASLPVVATTAGGIPSVVEDGASGLLVPPRRPDALAACILRLAGNAPERAALGANSSRVSTRFDIGRATQQIEEIYDRALASRRLTSR